MSGRVVHYTDADAFGGAERALLMLLGGLDLDRWPSTLLYHPSRGIEPLLDGARDLGVPVRAIPPLPYGVGGALATRHLVRLLLREQPLVFHAQLPWPLAGKWGLAGAVAARVPAVATVHVMPEFTIDRSTLVQQRLLARLVGRYIAVSEALADDLVRRLGWPRHKIRVIRNAAAGETSDRAEARRLLGEPNGRGLVVTAVRLDEQKGVRYLVDAAADVPDARFVVLGDGPDRRELEERARRLGVADRVEFAGWRDDAVSLLAGADVVALPSLWEGLPLVLLEAMAAARPVVATAVGGTPEAVRDGETGLLVPPRDPVALAAAIRRLLADEAYAERLGAAAAARVRSEFSVERMVGAVTSVYRELLGSR